MADHDADLAVHATLAAATVDVVTLSGDFPSVEVVNRDGGAAIFFTVDDVGGPAGDGVPTVAGDDTFVVPAAVGAGLRVVSRVTAVTLISSGTPAYSVQGVAD